MIKSLIKSTNEIRVETKPDCDELHDNVYAMADKIGCKVTAWTETPKNRKEKGEIVEEWYICKYTLTFNDPKAPETFLKSIDYNMIDTITDQESVVTPW